MANYAKSLLEVNKAIAVAHPGVFLVRGDGYHYIASNDKEMGLKIASLYTSSIPVYSVTFLSVEDWVEQVRMLLNQPLS